MEPSNPLWTPEEAALWLRVTVHTLYEYLRDGRLPAAKIGRYWRIDPVELAKFARADAKERK